jgi:hypothetical protein
MRKGLLAVGLCLVVLSGCTFSVGTLTPKSEADIPRISARDLWDRLQGGEAILVVDARSLSEFEMEHIAGSVSIPAAEVAQRIAEIPKDYLIVFY